MKKLLITCLFILLATTAQAKTYDALVVSCYDADTFTLDIDLGFHITMRETVRLNGIDTPELRTKNAKEKHHGYKARDYVRGLILGQIVEIEVFKEDKYGRYLVDVIMGDTTLTEMLVSKGYGYRYDGGTKRSWADIL